MTSLDRAAGAKNRGDADVERRWSRMIRVAEPPSVDPSLGPCIIHLGADNGNGYVQFRYDGKNGYAHRYAWERVNGPIPSGLTVDHLCEVKRCVNVEHLTLAEAVPNYLRTKLAQTHCRNDHEYTPENTVPGRHGTRRCKTCDERARRKADAKRRRIANGLPDRRITYDQTKVREVIAEVRAASLTIAQAAREVGCNPNYLGRRVWSETRRDVLARDGHACQSCGERATDAHHRIARGAGGSTDPRISFGLSNIISLCRRCHSWVETHPQQAGAWGYHLHRNLEPANVPVYTHLGWTYFHDDGSMHHPPPLNVSAEKIRELARDVERAREQRMRGAA